ncbi:glutathione S-transferase family protein [Thioalbus denitrificans]|uniref:Putative glutathione S-transferase n=1 Tax=Thioalbus denitrificans TaxID=547122 RepID=A0A369CBX2_9GAMM|nr:glutathione S-transferase C-terminal domain-containing protein [Thioalbus denitrificans]RCX31193.1 putative glutathione S-transferase [Thioalbus denitrificans]
MDNTASSIDSGRFVRPESAFRNAVSADGASGFPAVPGRYRLYVSMACPWAHRTLIARVIKGLERVVSVGVTDPIPGTRGWRFPGAGDPVTGARHLRDLYERAAPGYDGVVSVPLLWDTVAGRPVNNESAEILRQLNGAFEAWARPGTDLYPAPLRREIDAVNGFVYAHINNGVYQAGFARSRGARDEAVRRLFGALDALEERLSRQRWLVGERPTEADWRLFTTLARFDTVYHGLFRCDLRRLTDYPALWAYTRELYQQPGIAATLDLAQVKRHYYLGHPELNPGGAMPVGPDPDFGAPHGRDALGGG